MNIQMQLAGMGMLALLLCFYLSRKPIGLYTEVFFKRTMVITLINVSLDMLSVVAIVYRHSIPALLCTIVCKTYLMTLMWTGCCGLLYICQDIFERKIRRYSLFVLTSVAFIGNIIVACMPISYFHEGNKIYTYGPAVFTTYVFCLTFVVSTLCMALIYRKRMNPQRVKAVVMWILVWVMAAIVQFFNNEYLLVGYASCIGMMILFFRLENPEASIDKETGAYNSHVFLKYLHQFLEKGVTFSALHICLEPRESEASMYESELELIEMVKFFGQLEGTRVFKGVEREFYLSFENEKQLDCALKKIQERFQEDWNGVRYDPIYVMLRSSSLLKTEQELLLLFGYYKHRLDLVKDTKCIELTEELVLRRREFRTVERVITDALAEDRVEVFFQPIYSTKEKRFVTAEALARIRAEDGSILTPGYFIPVAEETGLIDYIGERVFEKTCQFIKEEKIWELGIEYIEVNLSVRECESRSLSERYKRIIRQYGVEPCMINLEVTESMSLRMRHTLLSNMEQLIDYGVSFSLDDFGNGASNLNYIMDMPVEVIKFDCDMTRAYFEKERGKIVLETVTRMILNMDLKIVSEGVETKEQLEAMEQLGVHYIQGYYFSKPLPGKEFIDFIEKALYEQNM